MDFPRTSSRRLPDAAGRWRRPLAGALLAAWIAMLLLGGNDLDQLLLRDWHVSERPWVQAVIFVTRLGDWEILVSLTFLAAALLTYRRRWQSALFLIGSTLAGRLLVGIQKAVLGRARPELTDPFVVEETFAFPSGHAANSLIVFVLIAILLVRDPRRRQMALAAAVLTSLLVGVSRVLLGVHWPSDVVGGWAFGLLWLLLCLWAARRWFGPTTVPKRFTEG